MVAVLPFFPGNDKADLLPTSFDHGKHRHIIAWGANHRTFEHAKDSSVTGRWVGNRSQSSTKRVTLLLGNVPIPRDLDYYFEVKIVKTDGSSHISVGLSPGGRKKWDHGSYSYQANRVKCWFPRGGRRTDNFGAFFASGNIVGCGWKQGENTIYYTKNGEDLGAAYSDVSASEPLYPAVSFTPGVKIHVNFGQEPFAFNVVEDASLDEEQREKLRKAAEERRKKEIAEEEALRKKEKEEEERRQREAAQPILNMGYTLTQALKALSVTGYNGVEVAVLWLIENPDYNFGADPPSVENPKLSESTELPKEEKATTENAMDVDSVAADDDSSYNTDASRQCLLRAAEDFESAVKSTTAEMEPLVSSEWEDRLIPELKSFMEIDGFSYFEVDEYLQQIRNELANGREQQALDNLVQIMGDAVPDINLSSFADKSMKKDGHSLKVDQVGLGDQLVVRYIDLLDASPSVRRFWNPETDSKYSGEVGVVRAVEHKTKLVRLEFFSPEEASLTERWYPVGALTRSKKKLLDDPPLSKADLISEIIACDRSLTADFARRALLSLLSQMNDFGSLSLSQYFSLVSEAYLEHSSSVEDINFTATPHSPFRGMEKASIKMRSYLASLRASSQPFPASSSPSINQFVEELSEVAISSMNSSLALAKKATSVRVGGRMDQMMSTSIEGSNALWIVFDRSAGALEQREGASLNVHESPDSPALRSFGPSSPPSTFEVLGSTAHYLLQAKSTDKSLRLSFHVVPVSADLLLFRWIVSFIMSEFYEKLDHTSLPSSLPGLMEVLYSKAVDYLYRSPVPTPSKEAMMYLTSELLTCLRRNDQTELLSRLPLDRLAVFQKEMVTLYNSENQRRPGVCSAYLQALINLAVSVHLQEIQIKSSLSPSSSTATSSTNAMEVDTPSAAPDVGNPRDEAYFAALALAQAIREQQRAETEDVPPTEGEVDAMEVDQGQVGDEKMSTAVVAEDSDIAGQQNEDQPGEEDDVEAVEGGTLSGLFSSLDNLRASSNSLRQSSDAIPPPSRDDLMNIDEGGSPSHDSESDSDDGESAEESMDDELRLALALSMSGSTGEDAAEPPAPSDLPSPPSPSGHVPPSPSNMNKPPGSSSQPSSPSPSSVPPSSPPPSLIPPPPVSPSKSRPAKVFRKRKIATAAVPTKSPIPRWLDEMLTVTRMIEFLTLKDQEGILHHPYHFGVPSPSLISSHLFLVPPPSYSERHRS